MVSLKKKWKRFVKCLHTSETEYTVIKRTTCYEHTQHHSLVQQQRHTDDFQINTLLDDGLDPVPNPLGINFYVLGYDKDNKLQNVNQATKQNLQNYLSYYRILKP